MFGLSSSIKRNLAIRHSLPRAVNRSLCERQGAKKIFLSHAWGTGSFRAPLHTRPGTPPDTKHVPRSGILTWIVTSSWFRQLRKPISICKRVCARSSFYLAPGRGDNHQLTMYHLRKCLKIVNARSDLFDHQLSHASTPSSSVYRYVHSGVGHSILSNAWTFWLFTSI